MGNCRCGASGSDVNLYHMNELFVLRLTESEAAKLHQQLLSNWGNI